jgi:hypothetical protein
MAKLNSGTRIYGNVTVDTFVTATGNVQAGNVRTVGLISATGSVTAISFVGNVSATTVSASGNIDGGNLRTAGLITATGNITGGNLTMAGAGGNITGANVIVAVTLSATGNVQAGNVRTTGNVSVTGNVTATSFVGNVSATTVSASGNIDGGNLRTVGLVTATGNIVASGTIISGGGSGGNITGANVISANTIIANTIISTSYPTVLDDITNQFDNTTAVFRLTVNTANVTTITDSKNLMVAVGGQMLAPYVQPITWPFFPEYDSWRGFRVRNSPPGSGNVVVGSNIIIYNSPAIGSDCSLTIINNSATVQTRRYPFAPTTIALEVD